MEQSESVLRRAVHEAGHAVIARAFDLPFTMASIVDDSTAGSAGRVLFDHAGELLAEWQDGQLDLRARAKFEAYIMCALAGASAEIEVFGLLRPEDVEGFERDKVAATGLAILCSGSIEEAQAYIDWLLVRTTNKIRQPFHRAGVNAIAERLTEQRTMTSAEVSEIVAAAKTLVQTKTPAERVTPD